MIRSVRLLLAVFLTLGVFWAAAPSANAEFKGLFNDTCQGNSNATVCKEANKSQSASNNSIYGPNGVVGKVVNILSIIIGVAAVIVIIIAGIQYMVSTGDPTKTNNAKNAILYAVVGLVIALLAQIIIRFVIVRIFS